MTQTRRDFFKRVTKSAGTAVAIGALGGSSLYAAGNTNYKKAIELTEEQKDKLFFIYQEEKLARDVYITLGETYTDESTFAMIQHSEQLHIDAAEKLCQKYDIDISYVELGNIGEFEIPVLQNLYDTCITQGELNITEALAVGELVEVTDIHDLTEAIEMDGMPEDIIKVYTHLRDGSYNHLDAFRRALSREAAKA